MPLLKQRNESKFTYKNLLDLNDPSKSYKSPLSVIGHVDLNAFFAQCEQLRLGLSDDDPVVCVQWTTIIAVSYAAREYGISRSDKLEQAKLKCPNIIAAHTAVFKKGEPFWRYLDHHPSPIDHKVSLDPYRREGKKVLRVFQEECDMVEKASVDESFMDFGRLVFQKIIKYYPDIFRSMQSSSERLPPLKELPTGLEYKGYIISKQIEEENGHGEVDEEHQYVVEDWDDLVMLLGSSICYELRKKVEDRLGYKTSGGVGRVKTIAKLASGFKKPNQQTIVRNDAIPQFLKFFKLSDFWSFGGKTGKYVLDRLDTESIDYIRNVYDSPAKLSKILESNKDLASRVYKIVRGELADKVENKEVIKSMMSNKNFVGNNVRNTNDLLSWVRVFVGELILRNKDLDEEVGATLRPTKMTISALNSRGVRHSKQLTMNQLPKDFEELTKVYEKLSKELVSMLEETWSLLSPGIKMYPLSNCFFGVSLFKDINSVNTLDDLMVTVKKRKLDPGVANKSSSHCDHRIEQCQTTSATIDTLIARRRDDSPFNLENKGLPSGRISNTLSKQMKEEKSIIDLFSKLKDDKSCNNTSNVEPGVGSSMDYQDTQNSNQRDCSECGEVIEASDWQEHTDYHVALELSLKLNKDQEESYGEKLLKKRGTRTQVGKNSFKKFDKSQMKLPF